MDSFKKYINSHQRDFEEDFPMEKIWEKIADEVHPSPARRFTKKLFVQAAACIASALVLGSYLFYKGGHSEQPTLITEKIVLKQPDNLVTESKRVDTGSKVNAVSTNNFGKHKREMYASNAKAVKHTRAIPKINTGDELSAQLRKIEATPIYCETPEYFDSFIMQFKQMEKYAEIAQSAFEVQDWKNSHAYSVINHQKHALLSQLQFEIDKVNNLALRLDDVNNKKPYFITI
jgi:hypothetical protein